ncbi:hypothetical protein [Mucilaginibacter sp.]|uniref:hypothetical protein n=1 Tax=Mucilaginibacter sp. TaxID=1882438 RepID=UPI002841EE1D|nr:hypothetical protein [Mucilaginibacter sp.]MDR3697001.1 hypothetical protein [Mucilaginibacter sp.]
MRFACLSLFILCTFACLKAAGQQALTIRGVTSKKLSGERVSQVVIRDLRSGELVMSDELGWFTIKAAAGDTLRFTKEDFTEQKIVVLNGSDMPVYMQPVIKLNTVTVLGESKKQELNDVLKDFNRKGVYYNGDPPLLSVLLNPLNDLHTWFGKDAANLRRFKNYTKGELEASAVDRRYTVSLVKKVTNAPDSTVKKFMEYYRPSYEDIKVWNDYDLMKKVKRTYDYYVQNKSRLGQPKPVFQTTDKSLAPVSLDDGAIK